MMKKSVRLGELLAKQSVKDVVIQVTGLDDQELIDQIVEYIYLFRKSLQTTSASPCCKYGY